MVDVSLGADDSANKKMTLENLGVAMGAIPWGNRPDFTISTAYGGPLTGAAASSGVMAANRIYAQPTPIFERVTINTLAICCTALAVGNARLALYTAVSANGGMHPGVLIEEGAAAISTVVTGILTTTLSARVVEPGMYFLMVVLDATPTLTTVVSQGLNTGWYATGTTCRPANGLYRAFTYAAFSTISDESASVYATNGSLNGGNPVIMYKP